MPVTSCTTAAESGMEVTTASPYIEGLRRDIIDLILSDHPYDCMVCERAGECELQELAYKYQIRTPVFRGERRIYPKRDGNPFIERDMEKCILCGRCVKVCDEVQGVGAIDLRVQGIRDQDLPALRAGPLLRVLRPVHHGLSDGRPGQQAVPGQGKAAGHRNVETVCPYCGCGCNLTLHVSKNEVIRPRRRRTRSNEGWLCVKGRFGF